MPSIHRCRITRNEDLSHSIFRLTFHCPEIAESARPGQFVNVRVSEGLEPFWRRPFSICSVDRERGLVVLLFAVLGLGTQLLAQKHEGESLNILGGLGNSFPPAQPGTLPVLIAGGLGIAPLFFLAEELCSESQRNTLLFGARTGEALQPLDDLRNLSTELLLATEDGTKGHKGLVTDLLSRYVEERGSDNEPVIFACGPDGMLKSVAATCRRHNLQGQVSLETLMACGFGACAGCAVRVHGHQSNEGNYQLVCKDGPVFDISEINFGA